MVAWTGFYLMVEIFNYVAILRNGPHRRYPLVQFAWFTLVWILMVTVVVIIVGMMIS